MSTNKRSSKRAIRVSVRFGDSVHVYTAVENVDVGISIDVVWSLQLENELRFVFHGTARIEKDMNKENNENDYTIHHLVYRLYRAKDYTQELNFNIEIEKRVMVAVMVAMVVKVKCEG
ncbi:hypothetical protein Tco_0055420 [Tanacetum coccineum]